MADLPDDNNAAENDSDEVIEVDRAADEQINEQIRLNPTVNNRRNLYSIFLLFMWFIRNMLIHHPLYQVIVFWANVFRLARDLPMIQLGQTQLVPPDPTFHRDQVEDWTGRATHPSDEFNDEMLSNTVHAGIGQNEGVPPTDEVDLVQNLVPVGQDGMAIHHDENEEEHVIHHPNIADVQIILTVLLSAELMQEPIARETLDQPMVNLNPIVSNEVQEETESNGSSEDKEDTQAIMDDHRHVYTTVTNDVVEQNSTNEQLETDAQTNEIKNNDAPIPQILVIDPIPAEVANTVLNSSSGDFSNEVTDPPQLVEYPVDNRPSTIFRPKTPESIATDVDGTSDQIDVASQQFNRDSIQ